MLAFSFILLAYHLGCGKTNGARIMLYGVKEEVNIIGFDVHEMNSLVRSMPTYYLLQLTRVVDYSL